MRSIFEVSTKISTVVVSEELPCVCGKGREGEEESKEEIDSKMDSMRLRSFATSLSKTTSQEE